jgi:excisionase family DNA binding protein
MSDQQHSPWMTAEQAAKYLQTGVKVVYRAAARGDLRVVRIGGRRDIRTKVEWLDLFVELSASPQVSAQ